MIPSRDTISLDQLQSSLEDNERQILLVSYLAAKVVWKSCLLKGNSTSLLIKYNNVVDLFDKLLRLHIVEIDEQLLGILNQCCVYVRLILIYFNYALLNYFISQHFYRAKLSRYFNFYFTKMFIDLIKSPAFFGLLNP